VLGKRAREVAACELGALIGVHDLWRRLVERVVQGIHAIGQTPTDHMPAELVHHSHQIVSAWSVDRGISLGQLATDDKSDEIDVIPELLENIEIKDAVVTIDAAGCQRKIAKPIAEGHSKTDRLASRLGFCSHEGSVGHHPCPQSVSRLARKGI